MQAPQHYGFCGSGLIHSKQCAANAPYASYHLEQDGFICCSSLLAYVHIAVAAATL
jgi:hypothetical protein